jgi:hypothetical protein
LYFEGDHWVVHYLDRPSPSAANGPVEIAPRPYGESTIRAILDEMAADA